MNRTRTRRALRVAGGLAVAGAALVGTFDAAGAARRDRTSSEFTVSGQGTWQERPFDVVVNGEGELQLRGSRNTTDVLVASSVDADDGTMPAPGECEGAITTVTVYGARRIDFTMIGVGEVCGLDVQPPTSIVSHVFTGTFEVYDVRRGTTSACSAPTASSRSVSASTARRACSPSTPDRADVLRLAGVAGWRRPAMAVRRGPRWRGRREPGGTSSSMRSRSSVGTRCSSAPSTPSRCSIVRGPTIVEVTAGCSSVQARARCGSDIPASPASLSSSSTRSSLRALSGCARVEAVGHAAGPPGRERGGLGVAPVLAAQPAAVQRAPHDDAHAVALADRQQVTLDRAHEDRVGRLLAAEALTAAALGRPLRLDDQVGREGGRADGPHLALVDEVRERAERLVDVGRVVRPVHLVEVDPVGAETAQAVLARADDVAPAGAVRVRRPGWDRTGPSATGKWHFVARMTSVATTAGQRLGDDLLALAGGVDVGGVDEVDAGVERPVDDGDAVVVVRLPKLAEHHGAEAQARDLHPGTAEGAIGHVANVTRSSRITTGRRWFLCGDER